MPAVLIFSFDDIGRKYRLLRHAKSFASQPDTKVFLVGSDITSLPKDIEQSPNIQHKYIYHFPELRFKLINYLLSPISFVFYFFQLNFLYYSLKQIDFVLTNLDSTISSHIFSKYLALIFHAKLIFDIQNLRWVKSNTLYGRYGKRIVTCTSYRVCSTKALQVLLNFLKCDSFLIYDPPGATFKHDTSIKSEVLSFLGRSNPDTLIVSIPFPILHDSLLRKFFELTISLESYEVDISFIIQGNPKVQRSIEQMFPADQEQNHVQLHFVPINTDAYSHVLGCSDLCIVFDGSVNGLDFAPEVTDAIGAQIPILVAKHGPMHEIVNGNKGFVFKDDEELRNYIIKICISKEIDLDELKKNALQPMTSWDVMWKKFYDALEK